MAFVDVKQRIFQIVWFVLYFIFYLERNDEYLNRKKSNYEPVAKQTFHDAFLSGAYRYGLKLT